MSAKSQKVHDVFEAFSLFLRRYQCVDPSISDLHAAVTSLSTDLLSSLQRSAHSCRGSVIGSEERWDDLLTRLDPILHLINSADVTSLCTTELSSLDTTLDHVRSLPLLATSLSADHRHSYQFLKSTIATARELLAASSFESLGTHLRTLNIAIWRDHEAYFRVAHIDKSWKLVIVDECRRRIERVIALSDIVQEIGSVETPASAEAITRLFSELADPHTSWRTGTGRSSAIGAASSARRAPKRPPRTDATSRSSFRVRSSASAARVDSEDDGPPRRALTPFVVDSVTVAPSDDRSSRMAVDFRGLHARVNRFLSALGPIDGLTQFLHELRVTGRLILQGAPDLAEHFAALRALIAQVEAAVSHPRAARFAEARANDAQFAITTCRKALADAQLRDGERLEAQFADICRAWREIEEERARSAAERIAARIAEELEAIEGVTQRHYNGRAQAVSDLRDVQAKISRIRAERRGRREGDADIARLLKEQGDLIEALARCP
jgi:hypothetical protein